MSTNCSADVLIKNNKVVTSVLLNVNQPFCVVKHCTCITDIDLYKYKVFVLNYLGGGPVVRAWDQEVCSLCDLRFELCDCSYNGPWRLTWSLTSGPWN